MIPMSLLGRFFCFPVTAVLRLGLQWSSVSLPSAQL